MIHLTMLDTVRRDTDADRTARRRSAAVTNAFTAAPSVLDFSRKSAPAMPTSGTGSLADLYGSTVFREEITRREERAAQMDRLPAPVQRLAQSHGITDISLLSAIGIVHKASATMGGQPAQCFAGDIGRAIAVTTQRAEAFLDEAAARGFIQRKPNHYWKTLLL